MIEPILEDNTLEESEKLEILESKIDEYLNDDSDEVMDKLPKSFALQTFFDFSVTDNEEDEFDNIDDEYDFNNIDGEDYFDE